jgi:hypothetical protein
VHVRVLLFSGRHRARRAASAPQLETRLCELHLTPRFPGPQADAKVADVASGLKAVGVPAKGRVGVFGANSPEWMITMQVCRAYEPLSSPHAALIERDAMQYRVKRMQQVHADCTMILCTAAAVALRHGNWHISTSEAVTKGHLN